MCITHEKMDRILEAVLAWFKRRGVVMREMNLPEHWKMARLGEVTNIFKGGTPKRSVEKYFRGDIPWAIPTDITALNSALYIDDTDTHISEEALGKSAARLLPAGTVLLTSRATIGETAITTVPIATNQGFANFICRDTLLNVYLAYYLRYIKRRLIDLAHGSTFKEITKGTLLNVEIPLPPLPEQRAIAHILGAIQEAKAARQREIELERERKAALIDHLFSYGTKGEPRKQTEIGEIPESWEVVRLGNYCYKPDYGYTESANNSLVGPKFLRITDIQNQEVNWETVPYCVCSKEDREKYLLKTGDIVIARIGATTGKAYMVADCIEAVFASYLIRVRTKNNLLPDFLDQYFRTNGYWRQINQSKGGRLKGGVNIPILSRLLLPLPRLSEQQEIAKILQACDAKIAALEQEAARLDELFHAMLDELMTGKRSAAPLIDAELPN